MSVKDLYTDCIVIYYRYRIYIKKIVRERQIRAHSQMRNKDVSGTYGIRPVKKKQQKSKQKKVFLFREKTKEKA